MKKAIIIGGVFGAAFSAIFVRYSTLPSTVLVFYRMLFTVIGLTPGFVLARKERANIDKKQILWCMLSGLFLGFHFIAYFVSLSYTSIASSVVLVDTEIFFVATGGMLFFHEKQSLKGWIGIAVTFVGSMIIAGGDLFHGRLLGDLIALAGAAFLSVYTMIGRKMRQSMTTTNYTYFVYACAGVVALVFSLIRREDIQLKGINNVIAALGMAVFCTLLGHSIYSWGLKYEKASFVSIVKLLEPVFASVLGFFLLHEIPAFTSCIGGVIVIGGITFYLLMGEKADT